MINGFTRGKIRLSSQFGGLVKNKTNKYGSTNCQKKKKKNHQINHQSVESSSMNHCTSKQEETYSLLPSTSTPFMRKI